MLRETLRDELDGAEKVIRALKHLATKNPRSTTIARELAYFRKNKRRMGYARLKAEGYMIGSGIVEAACFLGDSSPDLVRVWPDEAPARRLQ